MKGLAQTIEQLEKSPKVRRWVCWVLIIIAMSGASWLYLAGGAINIQSGALQ